MKKLLLQRAKNGLAFAGWLVAFVCVVGAVFAANYSFAQPTIPTRLFDVRNGNGVVAAGVTYPQAIVIVFKDKAAKDEVLDAFAAQYNYQAKVADPANPTGPQIDNPQTKAGFANRQITAYVRDVYKAAQAQTATDTARKAADSAADAKLPPN